MDIIHQQWFVTLYPILVFGLGFLAGKLACAPLNDLDRSYKSGWDAGHDAAVVELRTIIREVLDESAAPNVLINRRGTPAFLKKQAD